MKKKISKQKLTLGLALCICAPIGISFIASCGNDTQSNTNVSQYAESVLDTVVVNPDISYNTTRIREEYPSFYYGTYIQPNLGVPGFHLGYIPEEVLISTVIQNTGLFNYTPTLLVDGKRESFTITCADVIKADDFTGELSLSVYITHNNQSLGYPKSSRKIFNLSGFKKFTSANDLFVQPSDHNKSSKFYMKSKNDKSISSIIASIKTSETNTMNALDNYVKNSVENEVIISETELNKIIGSDFLKTNFNAEILPYFGSQVDPLTKNVPTPEQGGGSFYVYYPFYIDVLSNEFTKMIYDKTTKKLFLYFDMSVGRNLDNVINKQEFSFEIAEPVTPPPY